MDCTQDFFLHTVDTKVEHGVSRRLRESYLKSTNVRIPTHEQNFWVVCPDALKEGHQSVFPEQQFVCDQNFQSLTGIFVTSFHSPSLIPVHFSFVQTILIAHFPRRMYGPLR
jgi:hypothetical protein